MNMGGCGRLGLSRLDLGPVGPGLSNLCRPSLPHKGVLPVAYKQKSHDVSWPSATQARSVLGNRRAEPPVLMFTRCPWYTASARQAASGVRFPCVGLRGLSRSREEERRFPLLSKVLYEYCRYSCKKGPVVG